MNHIDYPEIDSLAGKIESAVVIPAETNFLYRFARQAQYGVVEVGSYHGRSSVYLCLGAKQAGVPFMAVDTFKDCDKWPHGGAPDTLEDWKRNMFEAGLWEHVRFLRMKSKQAAALHQFSYMLPKPYDVLFIDANHEVREVERDFECWKPLLAGRKIVIFHDIVTHDGPKQVFTALAGRYPSIKVGNIGAISLDRSVNLTEVAKDS